MISIITPVFNVEKYIDRCINSILGQTYSDYELLLVNDGSKDSSGRICDNYAVQDTRIKVFHIENSGCAAARNYGLDHAKGDYICFVDSDDYLHPDYLMTLINLICNYAADIAMCNYSNTDSYGNCIDNPRKKYSYEVKAYSPIEISKEVYGKNFVPYVVVWNKLYSKKIWSRTRFIEKVNCEDEVIIQKLYHIADKIVFKDEPLYYYVQNNSGIIHNLGNSIQNKLDDMYGLYQHTFFLNNLGEKENASEAFHCYFAEGIQVLTLLKKEKEILHHGERITFKSLLRKFKLHYLSAKNEITISFKRRLYYSLFLTFPSAIIFIRSIKHKLKSKK